MWKYYNTTIELRNKIDPTHKNIFLQWLIKYHNYDVNIKKVITTNMNKLIKMSDKKPWYKSLWYIKYKKYKTKYLNLKKSYH